MNQLPSSVTIFFSFRAQKALAFIGKAAFSDEYYI
jgi:hypothetical protein